MSTYNLNCGVLGHVDSGKTSLCRSLHEVASTASMDKHPQSKERGITLDMGFSSFRLPVGQTDNANIEITLVDCPGHASLIRTVLGAAQIIDLCILVVDAQRGFQTQTAECVVIAEIVTSRLIIAVNKVDLIPLATRDEALSRLEKNIRKTMSRTRFGDQVPITRISAVTGEGLSGIVGAISRISSDPPSRDSGGCLHLAFDHCFSVKGQGTVFTGTLLSGILSKGQRVYLPASNEYGDVRSIQKFRKPSESASQGDRVGVCIPGVSPEGKERGDIFNSANDVVRYSSMVAIVRSIKYFKGSLINGKFHISIGHLHSLATPHFFRAVSGEPHTDGCNRVQPDRSLLGSSPLLDQLDTDWVKAQTQIYDETVGFELVSELSETPNDATDQPLYCWLQFDAPLRCSRNPLMIASKLDLDCDFPGCRLAFYGRALTVDQAALLGRILKTKRRCGRVERKHSDGTYIVRGLLKNSASDATRLIGNIARHIKSLSDGLVESTFGKSGLLKVSFPPEIDLEIGDEIVVEIRRPALAKIVTVDQT